MTLGLLRRPGKYSAQQALTAFLCRKHCCRLGLGSRRHIAVVQENSGPTDNEPRRRPGGPITQA